MAFFNKLFHYLNRVDDESKLRTAMLFPLGLLSFFYGRVVAARAYFYSRGIFKTHTLPCNVVSVGNITLGGTGKTPMVCFLAEMLQGKGVRVAILSRGYKGLFQGAFGMVSDGRKILMGPKQAGDEPYLLARKLAGVPVIIGKERRLSGQWAIDQFQTEVLILDDAYQHLALKRDLDLVLIDSLYPFGNGYLIPRGVLREPLDSLKRADAIILTKVGYSGSIENLRKIHSELPEKIPIFQANYAPWEILVFPGSKTLELEVLKGKSVLAFAGLAMPESFRQTLLRLGAHILAMEIFQDHHWYTPGDYKNLLAKAHRLGVDALMTTEKDLVRIQGFSPGSLPLWAIAIKHIFQPQDQESFQQFIFSRLGLLEK